MIRTTFLNNYEYQEFCGDPKIYTGPAIEIDDENIFLKLKQDPYFEGFILYELFIINVCNESIKLLVKAQHYNLFLEMEEFVTNIYLCSRIHFESTYKILKDAVESLNAN